MAKIAVFGVKELDRRLASLGPKIANKVVRSSLRKAGKMVHAQAQQNLQQNDSVVSGELRKGLKVRAMKRSRSTLGVQVATTTGQHEDPDFGGSFVELGAKQASAKPFLRPAVYDNEAKIRTLVIEDVTAVINQVAAGAAVKDAIRSRRGIL